MSHYRERRDKIKNLQSKSLDHLASGAASKPSLDVPQPGPLEQSQSHKRLRESSPKWKEHYSKLSQQWTSGVSLAQQESNVVWEDVRQRKEKGGYPWTHLSHHQDEEVWLNPQKLPQDIGSVTMLRKDNTIPKEWFHLPKGAEVPTVDDLLRDSSPEIDITDEEAVAKRAKSPPICGRQRSKSRERVPHKHQASSTIGLHQRPVTPMSYDAVSVAITPAQSVYSFQHPTEQSDQLKDEGDFDKQSAPALHTTDLSVPVSFKTEDRSVIASPDGGADKMLKPSQDNNQNEAERSSDSDTSTSCFSVLQKSRSRSKSKERKLKKDKLKKKTKSIDSDSGKENKSKKISSDKSYDGPELLPKSNSGTLKSPPKVDRSSKPNTPPKSPISSDETDGYEPVENGAKTHVTSTNIQELPYADSNESKPSFKDRFPRFHRDPSRGSGKRDSSRGSGYEPVGWENDNLKRSKMSDSKDEMGSKHYEDLDQDFKTSADQNKATSSAPYDKIMPNGNQGNNDEKESEMENLTLQNGNTLPGASIISSSESPTPHVEYQDDELRQKVENEKILKDRIKNEDEEKRRLEIEQKEREEKDKREQKAIEEQAAKEKKMKEQLEKERTELEEKEKKRLAKEQKEKDDKLKKEQRKAKEIEEKERKLQEKLDRERNEREQKEKKRKEKEAKENEQRMLKEKKEAEDREAKERKAREKKEKENRQKEEKERNRLLKEQKEKEEQARKEASRKAKEVAEIKGEMQKEGGKPHEVIGIQNYDSNEAPSMITKERQFDESHNADYNARASPKVVTKPDCDPVKTSDSYLDSHRFEEESRPLNPFESEDTKIVENGHENKDNEQRNVLENEDKSIQFDEKSYTTPYETDKTDFLTADNTLVSNEDTFDGRGSELKLHPTDHTLDSVSFSSLPSDSQIIEGHSKSNLLDDHALQEDIEECDDGNKALEGQTESIKQLEENVNEKSLETIPEKKSNKDESLVLISNDQYDPKSEKSDKQKEERELKRKLQEDEKRIRNEEKEKQRIKEETKDQKQKELKEKWEEQDKENTLKRKKKLKEAEDKKREEKEKNKLLKEEEEKYKAEENEAKRSKNESLALEQQYLKNKWHEQDKDDTLKRKEKLKQKALKEKDEEESIKLKKEEEAKKKEDEKDYLRSKTKKSLDHQDELKKRWSEYEEDNEFSKIALKENEEKKTQTFPQQPEEKWEEQDKEITLKRNQRLKEAEDKKNEEKEKKEVLKKVDEKRKAEENEAKRLQNEYHTQEQQYLKEKWNEQDKENTLKRKEKLEQKAMKAKENAEREKASKEEEAKRKEDEKKYLRSKKEKSLDRQNELKKRWSEHEEDDEFSKTALKENETKKTQTFPQRPEEKWEEQDKENTLKRNQRLKEAEDKKKEEKERKEVLKKADEKRKAEENEAKRLRNEYHAQEQLYLKEKWNEQDKENTLKRKEKLQQKAMKAKENAERDKALKEEDAKRKEDEKEYLRSKKEKSLDRQNELKKRWSEYDEDDEFLIKAQKEGNAKKDEKLPLKSLGPKDEKEEGLKLEVEKEKKKEEEKESLRLKKKSGADRQNELKKRWSEYNEDDDFGKKSKKEDNETREQDERDEKEKEREEKQMKTDAEKETLKTSNDDEDRRQKELKQKWIDQENRRKNERKDKADSKTKSKSILPESPREREKFSKIGIQAVEDFDLNGKDDCKIVDSQNEVDHHLPSECKDNSGSTEEINDHFASTSEPFPIIPVDEQKFKVIDQQECISGETNLNRELESEVVADGRTNQAITGEDQVAVENITRSHGDVEKSLPEDFDSKELDLLLSILQKNDGVVSHFTASANNENGMSISETNVEKEDPDELKLLIEILNQKHIPLEKIEDQNKVEPSHVEDIIEKSRAVPIEQTDIGKQSRTDESNVRDKLEEEKSNDQKVEKNDTKIMKNVKKVDKEKAKQEKLENDKKRLLENQRKEQVKKEKKERERELKLEDAEQQKVLKEKWYQQENEKIDKEPKTIKELRIVNKATKTKEEEDLDDAKRKQISDHQQVLKQRWIEYDEDKKFYNKAKKQKLDCKKDKKTDKAAKDNINEICLKENENETSIKPPMELDQEDIIASGVNDTSMDEIDECENVKECSVREKAIQLIPQEYVSTTPAPDKSQQKEYIYATDTADKDVDIQEKENLKLLEKEIQMEEKRKKIEAQEVKKEEERKRTQQKLEQEKVEKQMKLEKKKEQEELEKEMQLKQIENQKLLKRKWIEQEEQKKSDKKQKRKEREKIEETTIRIVDYPEPLKEDLDKTRAKDSVNNLLVDFADSVSSDILKGAKDNNTESVEEFGAFAEEPEDNVKGKQSTEIITHKTSSKSSKDEGLSPAANDSGESLPRTEIIPVLPHSEVEMFLRIIKETDNEFKEKEKQIIDEIERKRKEEHIKQMEKELKKQKREQEKLRKENEKAQIRQEKLEKEARLKKEKEEKRSKKAIDAKLKKENEAESRRLAKESSLDKNEDSEVDSATKARIEQEKILALEKEMSHYRITPDVDEEIPHTKLDTVPEDQEEFQEQADNPFEDDLVPDEDTDHRGTVAFDHEKEQKEEPRHVSWTPTALSSNAKQETQTSIANENIPVKVEKPFLNTKKQDTPAKLPDIPSPPPSKEIFLTQPEEEQKQTSVMAASMAAQRADDFDEFGQFATGQPHQNGGGVSPDGIEYDNGYEEDELDFTPQNGYVADEPEFVPYQEETPAPVKEKKAPKERKSREPIKMPTVDIKGKLDSMKGIKMPSAADMAESLNPMNSLKRPLGVRVREEDPAVQRERALIVKNSTPSELGNLRHPLDIPMPKLRSRNKSAEASAKKAPKIEENGKEIEKEDTSTPGKGALFNTLPRSLRQQNLVTSVREIDDPKVLKDRQELIKNYSPSELAQIRGISDFPVPSKLTTMFDKKEKEPKRAPSADQQNGFDEPKEPWSLYGTLPRSMRETKLLTNTKEMVDPKELEKRQELIRSKTPSELAQIRGFDDIPVPSKIQNVLRSRSRSGSLSKMKRTRSESLGRRSGSMTFTLPKSWRETKLLTGVKVEEDEAVLAQRRNLTETKSPAELSQITSIADLPLPSALESFLKSDKKPRDPSRENAGSPIRINLDNMYDNLPRSLTQQQLLVKSKVEEDPEVLKKRQDIVASKKPAELAQIGGFNEIPLPTALENIFKGGPPTAPRRKSKDDRDGKRKRNFTTGGILSYDNVPEGLKTQLLVKTKVEEDPEILQARQTLTRTKTPNQLGQIHGLDDIPLPQKLDTLVRPSKRNLKSTKDKQQDKKRSVSLSSLTGKMSSASMPDSMKQQLLVKSRMEDPEVQKQRQEVVNTKSVAELGEIHGFSDFPVPATLERLVDKSKRKPVAETEIEDMRPLKDKMYDTLPKSMKQELLVKVRDEDPEVQKKRQELTRSKSPVELSQISSLSDFPVPATIEKILQKPSTADGVPVPPPRRSRLEQINKENLYETFPSLNTQCSVRSRVLEDEEVIKQRQELIRSKSPAQLSEIHGLDDIPVPGFVEHSMDSLKKMRTRSSERKEGEDGGTMYDKVPESLKAQLLVKTKVEDPEIQQQRAEVVKSKTVAELSQVTSLTEFPVPDNIERLYSRQPGAVERKKRFREKQRSLSAKNLNEMVPDSLKAQLLVKSKVEKPEVQKQRAELVSSKSVSELSQVTSLSEFPIPTTLERIISRSKGDLTDGSSSQRQSRFDLSKLNKENIYATLPKSLTEKQLLVKARVESPEVQKSRKETTENKSVAELSQINSLGEFPIPATIETLIEKGRKSAQGQSDQPDRSAMSSPSQIKDNIYATLPRSLKSELAVGTKVQDPELVQERREMIANKSVNELSQVTSLSDVPIPSPIQKMIDTAQHLKDPKPEGEEQKKSAPSSRGPSYDIYASLPRSLKSELLVRNKVEEDEEELKRRQNLVETKSPAELSQINSLSEVPVPRRIEAWLHGSSGMDQQSTLPRNKQEIKDIVYKSILPESMTKPCVVRSRIEDPDVLLRRQEIQQQKSIHELSKIRNVNEIPLPINVKLPDIPFPSFKAKNILRVIAPTANQRANRSKQQQYEGEYSPASTPQTGDLLTDDEMLRYDASTPGGDASHRDQDFGYECIGQSSSPIAQGAPQHLQQIPAQFQDDILDHASPQIAVAAPEEDSLAEQYRGTPPLKSKKKKPDRRSQSHEVSESVQLGEEQPPPLPPKRPSSVRRELRDSPLATTGQVSKSSSSSRVPGGSIAHDEFLSCADDPVPHPGAAPSSVRSSIRHSGSGHSFASARSSGIPDQFHSVASTLHSGTLVGSNNMLHDDQENTLAESIIDSMHSCADTIVTTGEDDAALHSCADTLAESDDEVDFGDSPTPPIGSG